MAMRPNFHPKKVRLRDKIKRDMRDFFLKGGLMTVFKSGESTVHNYVEEHHDKVVDAIFDDDEKEKTGNASD